MLSASKKTCSTLRPDQIAPKKKKASAVYRPNHHSKVKEKLQEGEKKVDRRRKGVPQS